MKLRTVIQMAAKTTMTTNTFTSNNAGLFSFGCWQRGHLLRVHRNDRLHCEHRMRTSDLGLDSRLPDNSRPS